MIECTRRFDVVRTRIVGNLQFQCFVPLAQPEVLTQRIHDALARGRKIYLQADAAEIEPTVVAGHIQTMRLGLERSFRTS